MKKAGTLSVELFAHAFMLFLGLYGTVFCFVTGFSLPGDYAALGGACFALVALFTLVFALPKLWHRVLALGLLALAMGWWGYHSWQSVAAGAFVAAEQVAELFIAAFGLPGTIDITPYVGELPLELAAVHCTAFLTALFGLLGCFLGWVIGRGRSFWFSFWATFPFLLSVLANTVTPDWTPLTMLLLFWGLGLMSRLLRRSDPYGAAKQVLCAAPLALLLLVGLRVLIPGDGYQRQDWIDQVRLLATDWMTMLGRDVVNAPGTGTLFGEGADGKVDLSNAGPLNFSGRTVLRVESDTGGHMYLRGYSAGVYGIDGWEQISDHAYTQMMTGMSNGLILRGLYGAADEEAVVIDPAASSYYSPVTYSSTSERYDSYQPLNFPAMADTGAPAVRVLVENVGAPSGYVYTPYQLSTTPERMSGAKFVNDAYLARGAGVWKHILYARDKANPDHGSQLTGEAAAAEQAYRRFVRQHYTKVPDELGAYLDDLLRQAKLSVFEPTSSGVYRPYDPVASAQEVAQYLAKRCEYDPETPVTPEGQDFVRYFLNDSYRGYCMHFASAATLMLRRMGIPARYTAGYVADVEAGKRADVPDYNAHAWVEVYCEGYGWQPVEVTPGFSGEFPWERRTTSTEPTPTPTPSAVPTPSHAPGATPTPKPSAGVEEKETLSGGVLWWLLIPALLALCVIAPVLRRRWAVKERARRFDDADRNRAVIALYGYGMDLLAFRGETLGDERVEELGHKARFSQHTLTEEEHGCVRDWAERLAGATDSELTWWRRLVFRYWKGLF